MENDNSTKQSNATKPMLAEVFFGTAIEIKEFFNKKWCRLYGISEDKWNLIAPSTIDGLKIKKWLLKHEGIRFEKSKPMWPK